MLAQPVLQGRFKAEEKEVRQEAASHQDQSSKLQV
jgi:hypothetical protein